MSEYNRLMDLAANLDFSGFAAIPKSLDEPDCEPYRFTNPQPITIEEFLNKLPEILKDPQGNRLFHLTQSKIKEFIEAKKKARCPQRFRAYIHEEEQPAPDQPGAKELGNRFEYLAIGATAFGGPGSEPFLTKSGSPTADEKRIRINAQKFKERLKLHGIELDQCKVQPEIKIKCLVFHLDLLAPFPGPIIDTKYSALVENRNALWSDFGWHQDTIVKANGKGFHAHLQGRNYVLGVELERYTLNSVLSVESDMPLWRPFEFWVSNSKSEGFPHVYRFKFTNEQMWEHMNLLLEVIEGLMDYLGESKNQMIPSYKNCNCNSGTGGKEVCPLAESCGKYVEMPEVVEI